MEYGIVDGHCDTIVELMKHGGELYENGGHIDLKKLQQYNAPIQFFAIWLEPYFYNKPLNQTLKSIDYYYNEIDKNKEFISHVNTIEDIFNNKKNGRISGLLSLEGGEALEGELSNLRMLYKLGVRALTLTWNFRNSLGQGKSGDEGIGLTHFGKEVVKEMNRLGMLVDVSHLSDAGFWEVAEISKKPFIASHSNSREICNIPRNLTDNQIKTIAKRGGVIGINIYPTFVVKGGEGATIDHVMKHISHIIEIAGDDCIGLGCDYDGIERTVEGLEEVTKIKVLIEAIEKKYGENTALKIAEGNFIRVMEEVIG